MLGPVLAAVLLAASPAVAVEPPETPRFELYTMGPGDDLFSKFGHAALCVFDQRTPEGRCYNYGTADFTTPVPLTWNFLRGRAQFWVSSVSYDRMVDVYQGYDRTLYRQLLPLSPAAAAGLVAALDHDRRPENRYYIYHHFKDNCTTRLRDHLDAATGGALRRDAGARLGPTYRELVREGFSASVPLLALTELLPGRPLEARPTLWEAMFHPDVLRAEIQKRLGAAPEVIYERQKPVAGGDPTAGRRALLLAAIVLGAVAAATSWSRRRGVRRAGLVVTGLALGLVALILDAMALVSVLPEFRGNEMLLVFLPTDLALIGLGDRALRAYLTARLALLCAVALGAAVGLLIQPAWIPLALVALPVGAHMGTEFARLRTGGADDGDRSAPPAARGGEGAHRANP